MKLIVYPHAMEIGGSQLNAIELGAAVQRLGHEVLLVCENGPLVATAETLGLERCAIPDQRRRPSLPVMRLLLDLVRRRGIQLVHGYEWPPILDGWLGPQLRAGVPVVGTVMSSAVAPFVPRTIPLVVGTDELRKRCVAEGREPVRLLEPPVDVEANAPDVDGAPFRRSLGIASETVLLVVVCRLVRELKLEGLLTACHVVGQLVREGADVRLAIVGDGAAREQVEQAAARANAEAGVRAVHLTGELQDPRPAYAAADVVLGMGGSALRGMAFAKPLVVQGERGFWRRCDEQSVSLFLDGGWYGLGDGGDGAARLRAELGPLLAEPARRLQLGRFARKLVEERFSLAHAARVQLEVYEQALAAARHPAPTELARTLFGLGVYKVDRRWQRWRGTASADDFNALQEMRS